MIVGSTRAPKIGVILCLFTQTIQCPKLQITWESTFSLKEKTLLKSILLWKRSPRDNRALFSLCGVYRMFLFSTLNIDRLLETLRHRRLVTSNSDIHYKSIRILGRLLAFPCIRPVNNTRCSPGFGFLEASTTKWYRWQIAHDEISHTFYLSNILLIYIAK